MFFVSKPTKIEAFRWFGDARQNEDPDWIVAGIKLGYVTFHKVAGQIRMRIKSPYYDMSNWAQPGDWVIRDEEGMHKTMSHEAFNILYESLPNVQDHRAAGENP